MKVAIVTLLALCLITLWVIIWVLCKIDEDRLSRIVNKLDDLMGYKHDDLYLKLCAIRDDMYELVKQKKEWFKNAEEAKPDSPDALVIEPCPICGSIPAMYKHTELNSFCVCCRSWTGFNKYDGNCGCSICVVSDDKTTALTAWNDAVNDYIMHKNEEV